MFTFIRRHQTIGLLFIGLVIISFLIWFSPTSSYDALGGSENFGTIDGKPISRDEYVAANREARLAYFFRFQEWPGADEFSRQRFDANRETLNRLFLVRRLRELGVVVGDQVVADRIVDLFRDRRTGSFDARVYESFVQNRLLAQGISGADFERFLMHEIAIQHLAEVAGLNGGLVTPREAEQLYRQANEQFQVELAVFPASNYLAQVTVDPQSVAQFYTNREAFYRLPERVQVSYVAFEATNFLAEADLELAKTTNLMQQIDQVYQQQGAEAFRDDNNQVLSLEAARERIRNEYRQSLALRSARRLANEFLTELLSQPPRADSLDRLAAAKGYEVRVTEPFNEFAGPRDLKVPPAFTRAAFKLTPEAPLADTPIVAEGAVYVIAHKERIPSSVPPLESIQERVAEDYRTSQARELARKAGASFAGAVTNGLAQGKSFAALCAEANLTPIRPPPFSPKTASLPEVDKHVSVGELATAASTLKAGAASGFHPTRDGGFVVHLEGRLPVDAAKLSTELPPFVEDMRQERQFQAFNEWFRRQVERANITTPAAEETPPADQP